MDPFWLLGLGMAVVITGIALLRLHPFLALLLAALLVGGLTPAESLARHAEVRKMSPEETRQFLNQSLGSRVAAEFGRTCGNIGILIAMAALIGKCLLESGGADRIVRSALRRVGEKRAPIAFLGSGFVLSIPVFFDTVFFLLIPIAQSLRQRIGRGYALHIMAIIAGGSMAHSLVPPTPGPLFVADRLGVNLGLMICAGGLLGIFTSLSGYAYALWLSRRFDVPLRETSALSRNDLEARALRADSELPPLWCALLPIVLPVVLIASNTIVKAARSGAAVEGAGLWRVVAMAGDPNVALTLGALAALSLLLWRRQDGEHDFSTLLQQALAGGGLIILITAAGGAFGGILQQTGVGGRIVTLAADWQLSILPLAFFVTMLVRTAQGSATVAMITTVGILGTLADPAELPFHPVYLALAIGCGSKPFPWMNDSGFWTISRMSGMTVGETFKAFSFLVTVMALTGLPLILIAARIFPLR
jgi:gluconate:H+ symporter, GntP family